MKDGESIQRRESKLKGQQSTAVPQPEDTAAGRPRRDAAPLEKEQFHTLGATHITGVPAFDDAQTEIDSGVDTKSNASPSAKHAHILGDFQLLRKLGQGAMATVYKARQLSFERKVALKLLHKHVADNPKLVERFYREARIMGQLDHPNIVQGYGVGMIDGLHYFAMEYVSGANLQAWLNKLNRIPVCDALHIAIACARGLEYAHDHGLVHRDVKPDNVLITREGAIKLADLGMVKAIDEDMSLTQTGHAVGTPWYMPLEQARNAKEVDGRSDIYALGCMLYYLVTGRPPFRGNSIVEVIQAKEIGTFPAARQANPDVPDRLDLIIAKMTAKLPKHRYQHCREVIRDLQELNLASDELTFLHERAKEEETLMPGATAQLEALPPAKSDSVAPNVWYIQHKNSKGEIVVKRMNTEQLFALVGAGVITPNTPASRQRNGNFRSLATYKEFESIALALATKTGADKQSVKFRNLYKKLEERDERRVQVMEEEEEEDESIQHGLRMALSIGGTIVLGILLFFGVIELYNWFHSGNDATFGNPVVGGILVVLPVIAWVGGWLFGKFKRWW